MAIAAAEEGAAGPGRHLGRDNLGRLTTVVPTLEGVCGEEVVSAGLVRMEEDSSLQQLRSASL